MTHALISIHPRYVLKIVSGGKRVEIRTRNVSLQSGSNLWIYSTLPVGAIGAVATIGAVERLSPTEAWKRFRDAVGLTRQQYWSYVNGARVISVIGLSKVISLSAPLTLQDIRRVQSRFQPPQFLKMLTEQEGIYRLLAKARPSLFRS